MACSQIIEDIMENTEDVTTDTQTETSDTYDASIQTNMLGRLPECLPIEETNFLRFCHLIQKVAPGAVRQKFDQEFPPADLEANFQQNKNTLRDLKRQKVFTGPQWNLMFPGIGCCPSSSNFDITLMTGLFRHLTKISPISGSYDTLPPPSDVTLGADLARIKYYRNKIAHYLENDRKIDKADFDIVWNDICESLGRIGGAEYAEKCSKLLTTNLDSSHLDIYRDLCIQQQEMLKDPVPYHEREKIKEEIANWESKDTVFVETSAAKELMKTLQHYKFVIVTGGPGTGKSFTAQHVLLNFRNTEYDIIPVNSSSDIIRYFSSKVHQIFYLDDFCGTFNISNSDIEEWDRNKQELTKLFACTKTMCIFTCRSQIYQDSKFESLNLVHFKVIDLSGNHQLSLLDKRSVAQKYLDEEKLKSLDDETISNSLCFPLLCSLYEKHADESIRFFQKPATCFQTELSKLKRRPDKLKYACLALCVMLNNNVAFKVLTPEVSTETKQMIDQVFEALEVNVTTPRKTIISQFEAMVGSYFEKADTSYTAIHDYLFDIFCSHVSDTMIECVINYADSKLISQRALLESLQQNKESSIIIPHKYEESFFQRISRDIIDSKIVPVFDGHQMQYKSYREKFISFLNKTNLNVNVIDTKEFTPLLICSDRGYADLVEWLCDSGADVNQCHELYDTHGTSPLYFAALQGHKSCVDVLINKGSEVNKNDNYGWSPLHAASEQGQSDIVKILCEREADVNQCDNYGCSPMYVASKYGHSDIVKILCDMRGDVNHCDYKGWSPLISASYKGHTDIAKILCERGADVNQCDNDGWSPLYIASLHGYSETVNILCERGADVNQCDNDGRSPFYVVSAYCHSDIVKILYDRGSDVNLCNNDGYSPLCVASLKGHSEIVKILCERGGDVNQCNKYGWSPLYVASYKGKSDIVKILCERGANVNRCDKYGRSPMFVTSYKGQSDIVKILCKRGADVNLCDNRGQSALYSASHMGNSDIVKILCEKGADVKRCDKNGVSPLYAASYNGQSDIVKILCEKEADVNQCDKFGGYPLHVASFKGHSDIVKILCEKGADVKRCDKNGRSPLYAASYTGQSDIVKILCERGGDVNQCNKDGESPLYVASYKGHSDTVKILCERGGDVNLCAMFELSPLYVASQQGHNQIVDMLRERGGDINL